MKKICVLLLIVILLAGCNLSKTSCTDCTKVLNDYKIELMKEKLIEYGKLIYDNDNWMNGGIEPMEYSMSLREMSERNKYDVSMFKNPYTDESCNLDETKITFLVKSKKEDKKTNYEFIPYLSCGLDN